MDLTEEQIKQGLRNKLKSLEKQVELVKTALKAFGDELKTNSAQVDAFKGDNDPDLFNLDKGRKTVRARVEGLLADAQTPMTSKEIMLTLNKTYKKNYTIENFSGNFSQSYRKTGSKIKQFEVPDIPAEYRYVYGLNSWFDGEQLKQEFLQRFLDKH
jgi:hypothetical protein